MDRRRRAAANDSSPVNKIDTLLKRQFPLAVDCSGKQFLKSDGSRDFDIKSRGLLSILVSHCCCWISRLRCKTSGRRLDRIAYADSLLFKSFES